MRRLLVLAALVFALDALAQPRFVTLGGLPGGDFSSSALGVSADGSTVVGSSFAEAFHWTQADGMVGLGELPGGSFFSFATAVSADGSVVVGFSESASGLEAFRWTSDGGMVGLGDFPGGIFGTYSIAQGVSADGSTIVGFSESASGVEAFRWTSDGGMVALGELPGGSFDNVANGVSADGSTVVGHGYSYFYNRSLEAFRWTSGDGMVGLGLFAGGGFIRGTDATAVSGDGSTVVGNSAGAGGDGGEAFRWTSDGGMVGLGDLSGGSFGSEAFGVSADGSMVVGFGSVDSDPELDPTARRAFLWDATNGMRELDQVLTGAGIDLTGWTLEFATGISSDGRTIVGHGINPDGRREAWLAVIPVCGDGIVEVPEACDDGNTVTEACSYGQASCIVCSSTCQSTAGATSYCGNGTVDAPNGEACDDQNGTAGDGCSASCSVESPWHCAGQPSLCYTLTCSDGFDNDADGLIDFPADPGCLDPASNLENPACDDGLDNDADGGIDFDGGASANHGVAVGSPDPECMVAYRNKETPNPSGGCGLGAELAFVMPLVALAASRRRRAN